jgi:endoglucanase
LDFLVKEEYNMVRVPLSIEMMEEMDTLQPKTINYSANPDLSGKTAGQVLDLMFAEFAKRGILIMPDVHRNKSTDGITPLWYSPDYPETRLINAWVKLLKRYKSNPYVFAVDIRNEPHGIATWGGPPETDWASAAERIGNVILREFPDKLVMVAGVEKRSDKNPMKDVGAFWGGVLDSVRERPIKLDVPERLVYTPHVYGPSVFDQGYFKVPEFPNNLPAIWDNHFGYIAKEKLGCVFIGELGGRAVDRDGVWHEALTKYIESVPGLLGNFAMWSLNANSGDTGGLLKDDWVTPESHKLPFYRRMGPNPTKIKGGEVAPPVNPVPTPVPPKEEPKPPPPVAAPPPPTGEVKLTVTRREVWYENQMHMAKYELDVLNTSTAHVKPIVQLTNGQAVNVWSCAPLPPDAQGTQKFALPVWMADLPPGIKWSWGCIVAGEKPEFKIVG